MHRRIPLISRTLDFKFKGPLSVPPAAQIARLERELQAHLDATCIVPLGLRVKPAKGGSGRIDHDILRVEERVIESVDELRAKLQNLSFPDVGL